MEFTNKSSVKTLVSIILTLATSAFLSGCNSKGEHMPLADLHGKAGPLNKGGGPYYTTDITPILEKNCLLCHGSTNPSIDWTDYELFKSKKDRIISRVLGPSADMPKGKKLSDGERALLQAWIDNGMEYGPATAPTEPPTPSAPTEDPATPLPAQVQSCVGCHGDKGQSLQPMFPKLSLQTPEYLTSQLQAFRSKTRASADAQSFMWSVTETLTDEDISVIATYFAGQDAGAKNTPGAKEKIITGQELYSNGLPDKGVPSCAACHGSEGQGVAAMPRLAGQHKDYLVKQLRYFKTEERVDSGGMMSGFAKLMSEEDIESVSEYLNSL